MSLIPLRSGNYHYPRPLGQACRIRVCSSSRGKPGGFVDTASHGRILTAAQAGKPRSEGEPFEQNFDRGVRIEHDGQRRRPHKCQAHENKTGGGIISSMEFRLSSRTQSGGDKWKGLRGHLLPSIEPNAALWLMRFLTRQHWAHQM